MIVSIVTNYLKSFFSSNSVKVYFTNDFNLLHFKIPANTYIRSRNKDYIVTDKSSFTEPVHCDHAVLLNEYNISKQNNVPGYTVGYCISNINNILREFSMDLRIVIKVLKENNISELAPYNWKKLTDNIDQSKFKMWKLDIKKEVDALINIYSKMIKNKLTREQISFICKNRKVLINSVGFNLCKIDKDNKENNYVFEHSHEKCLKLFNSIIMYLNLSNRLAENDNDMYIIYKSINNTHRRTVRFLLHKMVDFYSRDFNSNISNVRNTSLGSYEKLLNMGWTEENVNKELYYMLSRDPLLDISGNIVLYFP
ncbi:hypothetical protein ABK040_014891 [Willaertia magna]